MPEWLSAVVGFVAIVFIAELVQRVLGSYLERSQPRDPSRRRTLVTSIALALAVVGLAGLVYYVFAK